MKYIFCPVCGYNLGATPYYGDIKDLYKLRNIKIDRGGYSKYFGPASFSICDCCGFEFGFDDDLGASKNARSFEQYLKDWIAGGCKWFDPKKKPKNWSLEKQLRKAGIKMSENQG